MQRAIILGVATSVAIMLLPMTANAQSSGPEGQLRPLENQAQFTLTVPISNGITKSKKTKPRAEFGIRSYSNSYQYNTLAYANTSIDTPYRDTRFGLTLETSPTVMINGIPQDFSMDGDQAELSNGTAVAIGAGVLVAVIVFAVAYNNAEVDVIRSPN